MEVKLYTTCTKVCSVVIVNANPLNGHHSEMSVVFVQLQRSSQSVCCNSVSCLEACWSEWRQGGIACCQRITCLSVQVVILHCSYYSTCSRKISPEKNASLFIYINYKILL